MIKPNNLLIVRTDRIGDLVLTMPLAEIVKRYYPNCKVTFLVRDYTKDILFNHPFIDQVISIKTKNKIGLLAFWQNFKLMAKNNYDTVIIVSPNFKIALLLFLTKIKKRIGTGYRWYSLLFNKKVFIHRKYAGKHELEFNVELLKEIGIDEKVTKEIVNYSLKVNKKSLKEIDNLFFTESIEQTKPLIIIHPGSGSSSVDLPINKFKELTEKISLNFEAEIITTGIQKEKTLCEMITVNESIHNYAGKFSLSQLIALIYKCDLFISNSTGPLHIASALNKNVIGFYPNLLTCSAKRWGPYSARSKVFTPPKNCKDCKMEQCSNLECMNNIDINDVINYIKKLNFNIS